MTKCKLIKERFSARESEKHGKWMTEERMRKSGDYSSTSIKSIISFCKKFPETLVRPGSQLHPRRMQFPAQEMAIRREDPGVLRGPRGQALGEEGGDGEAARGHTVACSLVVH